MPTLPVVRKVAVGPKSVEVAMNVGIPVAEGPRTPAVALPQEVVFPTEVTTPERLALVVTVDAFPPMSSVEVDT